MATVEEDRLRLQLKASTERLVAPVFPAVVGKGLGYIELAGHAEGGVGQGRRGGGRWGVGVCVSVVFFFLLFEPSLIANA